MPFSQRKRFCVYNKMGLRENTISVPFAMKKLKTGNDAFWVKWSKGNIASPKYATIFDFPGHLDLKEFSNRIRVNS